MFEIGDTVMVKIHAFVSKDFKEVFNTSKAIVIKKILSDERSSKNLYVVKYIDHVKEFMNEKGTIVTVQEWLLEKY